MTDVIQFIPSLFDGGAETLVKDYCILGEKYAQMMILCLRYQGETANIKNLQEHNIKIVEIYNKWNFTTRVFHKIFGKLYVPYVLKRLIKKEKPKAIHIHMALLRFVVGSSKLLNRQGVKLFYTCHNLPHIYFAGDNESEYFACKQLLAKNQLQLIALHEDMKNELNELFSINTTIVVNNGIDLNRFRNCMIDKKAKRNELQIPQEAYLIGNIGKLSNQKNHLFLLDVFATVRKYNSNAFLLIVGDGELKEKIKTRINELGIQDYVCLLSNRQDIPEILKAVDVFAFPSLYEGLGIVLIEAQACDLPCIVSEYIPHEAFKTKKITVVPVDKEHINDWARKLLDPIGNIDSWGNLESYNMTSIVQNLCHLYLESSEVFN